MGFGKTAVTLAAIRELFNDDVISRVLVLAPLKVCRTVWQSEAKKWREFAGLNIAAAIGTPEERVNAIAGDAQIVLMNYENLPWFCDRYKDKHDFDGLVCDEITKLKSSGSKGFKKLRLRLKPFVWRVGLSGTPVSEDFEGLYSMIHVLDGGKRLGGRKDLFLRKYFYATDYMNYNWELLDPTGAAILDDVKDLLFLADNENYKKSLPPISHTIEYLDLPAEARGIYDTMKADHIAEGISADNAAVVVGKLLQISNGFLYGDADAGIPMSRIHDTKLDKLCELVLAIGSPVIVTYWFKEDLQAIQARMPHAVHLSGGNDTATIEAWNAGSVPVLLLQPRSAGHGIQLQGGGADLIWYGPVWSRDLVLQTEARIHRQGQKKPVNVYTLVMNDTIDAEVVDRVENKGGFAELLTAHCLRY